MDIKKETTENLQSIIDNAPEWAVWYNDSCFVSYLGNIEAGSKGEEKRSGSNNQWHLCTHLTLIESIAQELACRTTNKEEVKSRMENNELKITVHGKREWYGSVDQYRKNGACIDHWCNDGDIEVLYGNEWTDLALDHPKFSIESTYRIAEKPPKTGEVWSSSYADVVVQNKDSGIGFDGAKYDITEGFHKVADNMSEYMAR